jgi:hypothetical protein
MSSAMFQILNLSTGEHITVHEYNRATINFTEYGHDLGDNEYSSLRIMRPERHIQWEDAIKSWYVSPPSDIDISRIALYLNVPINALDVVMTCNGYAYDAE